MVIVLNDWQQTVSDWPGIGMLSFDGPERTLWNRLRKHEVPGTSYIKRKSKSDRPLPFDGRIKMRRRPE